MKLKSSKLIFIGFVTAFLKYCLQKIYNSWWNPMPNSMIQKHIYLELTSYFITAWISIAAIAHAHRLSPPASLRNWALLAWAIITKPVSTSTAMMYGIQFVEQSSTFLAVLKHRLKSMNRGLPGKSVFMKNTLDVQEFRMYQSTKTCFYI